MSDDPSPSVNDEIFECLNPDSPTSFFLFAGAGSGKTRSLVEVLEKFKEQHVDRLRRRGQRVAIITYTNAACDEIKSRLGFDAAFHVSTIHSFSWELIKPYTQDIKNWLTASLEEELADLAAKQAKTKNTTTKTYRDRDAKIESKTRRLESLNSVRKFSYNPNGENTGRDSLNHSEVIAITADSLLSRSLMQSILVRKYPILLIDESQDTKKELIDAFFAVQEQKADHFTLGMFGDTMQRIYSDGKKDLGENIPESWKQPAKRINYRCPKRVIRLINKIRMGADGQQQEAGKDTDGFVRLFIIDSNVPADKKQLELKASAIMAEVCGDPDWNDAASLKVLTLEHHMAASRSGFAGFYNALYSVDKLKTGLLDGTLSGVTLFSNQVLPLIKAKVSGNDFSAASIVKKYSPLFNKDALKASKTPVNQIRESAEAVQRLYALWGDGKDPSLGVILQEVQRSGLFSVPDVLFPIAERYGEEVETGDEAGRDMVIAAWENALQSSFSQFQKYVDYISDESQFGTHQGIKGLEFPCVMVILDDEEARGFMFSYEKLFGAKSPTDTDVKNKAEGKETSIDRSRRLFYVTCSRAEESLAVVAYTNDPDKVKEHAVAQDWFSEDEIVILPQG